MKTNYVLNEKVNTYLNENSSYKEISEYFHFLVSHQDEICKSSSGTLKVEFPQYYGSIITIVLYGYDTLTLSRSEIVEGSCEKEVKNKVIQLYEVERIALLKDQRENYF